MHKSVELENLAQESVRSLNEADQELRKNLRINARRITLYETMGNIGEIVNHIRSSVALNDTDKQMIELGEASMDNLLETVTSGRLQEKDFGPPDTIKFTLWLTKGEIKMLTDAAKMHETTTHQYVSEKALTQARLELNEVGCGPGLRARLYGGK